MEHHMDDNDGNFSPLKSSKGMPTPFGAHRRNERQDPRENYDVFTPDGSRDTLLKYSSRSPEFVKQEEILIPQVIRDEKLDLKRRGRDGFNGSQNFN
jgi:hypothetical protein